MNILIVFTSNYKICCRFFTDAAQSLSLWTLFNDTISTWKNLHGSGNRARLSSSWTDASRSWSHLWQAFNLVDGGAEVFVWRRRVESADPLCLEQGDFAAHQWVASGFKENSKRICRLKNHFRLLKIFYADLSRFVVEVAFLQNKSWAWTKSHL